jgi:hypothetical protein
LSKNSIDAHTSRNGAAYQDRTAARACAGTSEIGSSVSASFSRCSASIQIGNRTADRRLRTTVASALPRHIETSGVRAAMSVTE